MKKYLLAIESAASDSSAALLELNYSSLDEDKPLIHMGQRYLSFNRSRALDHAEQLLPMVDTLLSDAEIAKTDLAAIAFSQGPGAFTGLRIACGLAQGMALGLDIPVIPIDSLRANAQLAADFLIENKLLKPVLNKENDKQKLVGADYIVTLLDARMGEAYMAIYKPRLLQNEFNNDSIDLQVVQKPSLIAIKDVLLWLDEQRLYDNKHLFFCGNALDVYEQELVQSFELKEFDFSVLSQQTTDWADASVLARLAFKKLQRGETIEAYLAAPIYLREKVAFTERERASGLSGNPVAEKPTVTEKTSGVQQTEKANDFQYAFQIANEQYLIRPMTEKDIAGALIIEQTVQDYPWTRGNFKDSLRSAYPAWVIEHKLSAAQEEEGNLQRVVGFAIQMIAPDVAHVLLIAVEPSMQSEGLGTLLLKVLEKNALSHGLDKQILEVRRSNDQAQRFYLSHHYAVIGTRKGYYREVGGSSEDAIVLEKTLTANDAIVDFVPRSTKAAEAQ